MLAIIDGKHDCEIATCYGTLRMIDWPCILIPVLAMIVIVYLLPGGKAGVNVTVPVIVPVKLPIVLVVETFTVGVAPEFTLTIAPIFVTGASPLFQLIIAPKV